MQTVGCGGLLVLPSAPPLLAEFPEFLHGVEILLVIVGRWMDRLALKNELGVVLSSLVDRMGHQRLRGDYW
jgi:hypothetical protein